MRFLFRISTLFLLGFFFLFSPVFSAWTPVKKNPLESLRASEWNELSYNASGWERGGNIDAPENNIFFNLSGNVGIGTTSPSQKLTVAGTIESTSGGFQFPDGTVQTTAATSGSGGSGNGLWSSSGNDIYRGSGNVGIGTTNPSEKLEVSGNGKFTGKVTSTATSDSDISTTLATKGYVDAKIGTTVDTDWEEGNGNIYRISGNVGIGTNIPGTELDVNGSITLKNQLEFTGSWNQIRANSDTDLHLRTLGTGDIIFNTNDSEQMRIIENGNVGIGTTSPNKKLDVDGSVLISKKLAIGGSTNPLETLHVYGALYAYGNINTASTGALGVKMGIINSIPSESTNAYIGINDTGGPGSLAGDLILISRTTTGIDTGIRMFTGEGVPKQRFSILSNGNVGIGATAPLKPLHIVGSDGKVNTFPILGEKDTVVIENNAAVNMALIAESDYPSAIKFYENGAIKWGGAIEYAHLHNRLNFYTNGNSDQAMVIDANGNIGIGTTTPNAKLDILNSTSKNSTIQLSHGDADGKYAEITFYNQDTDKKIWSIGSIKGTLKPDKFYIWQYTNEAGTNVNLSRFVLGENGNIAIGNDDNPGARLEVIGEDASIPAGRPRFAISTNEISMVGNEFIIDANGNVGIGTTSPSEKLEVIGNVKAVNYLTASDKRLKKNIRPMSADALDGILHVQAVDFEWKDSGKTDTGFIAQDLEKYFPEFVHTNPQTGYKTVEYSKMVVPLVRALQQMDARHEQEMQELRAEIKKLTAK